MKAPARTELADGALVLRPWRLEDVPRVTEICQDPEISRWTRVPSPYSEEHARAWIEQTERDWADCRHGAFAVTDPGDRRGRRSGRPAPARGLCAAGLDRLLGRPRGARARDRDRRVTDPENEPSQRVAEAAGFRRDGLLRSYIELQGGRRDCVLYSLLAGELEDRDRG
jgi:RimJ/RimL family protein N-acetyltransferase